MHIPGRRDARRSHRKVQRKGAGVKREEMDLRFLPVPCPGDEAQDIVPILVAMKSPHHDPAEDFVMQQELVSIFSHVRKAPASSSNGPGGGSVGGGAPSSPNGGNAAGTAGSLGNYSPTSSTEQPYRAAEVLGFPGVKLTLPILTTDPTGISSSHQVLIDPDTRFRLDSPTRPAPRKGVRASPDPARAAVGHPSCRGAEALPAAPPDKEEVDVENCVETGCAFADSPAAMVDSQTRANAVAPCLRFQGTREPGAAVVCGRRSRPLSRRRSTPHHLQLPSVDRASEDESARLASPRIIRALLFSIAHRQDHPCRRLARSG